MCVFLLVSFSFFYDPKINIFRFNLTYQTNPREIHNKFAANKEPTKCLTCRLKNCFYSALSLKYLEMITYDSMSSSVCVCVFYVRLELHLPTSSQLFHFMDFIVII